MIKGKIMAESMICEAEIEKRLLAIRDEDAVRVRAVLAKAVLAQGLTDDEVTVLMAIKSPDLARELFHAASQVKDTIYGQRLVIFAPLYISNLCSNECLYCAFRVRNQAIKRRALSRMRSRMRSRPWLSRATSACWWWRASPIPRRGLIMC